jgi:Fe-S cluster assembly ATPase SufC
MSEVPKLALPVVVFILEESMCTLQICADTIVGSHTRRGISGGQKKRVTTGEIVVGPCKVLLMDEISVRTRVTAWNDQTMLTIAFGPCDPAEGSQRQG